MYSASISPSVGEAVSQILTNHYLLYESLRLKIVNFHALAEKILPEVEQLTGKRPKLETVVVAIKRFSDGLEEKTMKAVNSLGNAKVTLTGKVAEITIEGNSTPTLRIMEDLAKLSPRFLNSPNIFQLPHIVKVLAEDEDAETIKSAISEHHSLTVRPNTARVTIRLPPEAEAIPGIIALVTELLNRSGISLYGAFFGRDDAVLVMDERFGPKAYQVLSKGIKI
jgi:hypothetical protein